MKTSLAAFLGAAGGALAIGVAAFAASSPEERLQRAEAMCYAYGFGYAERHVQTTQRPVDSGARNQAMAECVQREVNAHWF